MNCKTCDKPLSGKQRSYCSRECSNRRAPVSESRICKTCRSKFRVYPSEARKVTDYCSMACNPRRLDETYKACEHCGAMFRCLNRRAVASKRYCSRRCTANAARQTTEVACSWCGKPMYRPPSHRSRYSRTFCSNECSSAVITGDGHGKWKGGNGSYRGPNWWKQRAATRERDGGTCQRCGVTEAQVGKALDVHHKRPYRLFDDYHEANALDNLVSLCDACHLHVERTI